MTVLVTPGVQLISLVGMIEAFDAANRFRVFRELPPLYDVQVRSVRSHTQTVSLQVVCAPQPTPEVHTFVVGGSLQLDAPAEPDVLAAAQQLAARATRVVGVCTGAFLLGELGLLDGRRCTTHWLEARRLQERVPRAEVTPDDIFVVDGPVFTSAGATAAIDLALHLIGVDGGVGLARVVARALVVHSRRSGGQSQFGPALRLPRSRDERLRRLVDEVMADPGGDHGVERMARSTGMSPRHFARVFRAETGQTPAAFVARVRVDLAKRLLTEGDAGLDIIADRCGFRRAETLRRTFCRVVGVGPVAYRRRFGGA